MELSLLLSPLREGGHTGALHPEQSTHTHQTAVTLIYTLP